MWVRRGRADGKAGLPGGLPPPRGRWFGAAARFGENWGRDELATTPSRIRKASGLAGEPTLRLVGPREAHWELTLKERPARVQLL